MLVLTRKPGEKILIGDDIVITILDARGDSVRIGIDAPRGVKIQRDEVVRAVSEANLAAAQADATAEEKIKRNLGLLGLHPVAAAPRETPAEMPSPTLAPTSAPVPRAAPAGAAKPHPRP